METVTDRRALGTPIGPGRLSLVVGPSGAGKDTLIGGARAALSGDQHFVFARRIVTRGAGRWEDHQTLDPAAFTIAAAEGRFALTWEAHGLRYALPRSIDDDLARGRAVVCNVSRRAVAAARRRYGDVVVIYVDAPARVRAARLAQRNRESDLASRTMREPGLSPHAADIVIDNGGDLESASAAFLAALGRPGAGVTAPGGKGAALYDR